MAESAAAAAAHGHGTRKARKSITNTGAVESVQDDEDEDPGAQESPIEIDE
jgi:hypothetical protein